MEIKGLLLVNVVMYDGRDAYVQEICIDARYNNGVWKPAKGVKKLVEKWVNNYGMELLKIDCNTYHTVSIDDIMSWNDKNSDSETVYIKQKFIEMFDKKIIAFYKDSDYMN